MRVIWIEDEPLRVSAYVEVLRINGHEVELVQDIEEFQDRIQTGGFDIALVDLMLPTGKFDVERARNGLDTGLLVVHKLREFSPDVRFVLFTNRSDAEFLGKEYGLKVLRKIDVSPWDLPALLEENAS